MIDDEEDHDSDPSNKNGDSCFNYRTECSFLCTIYIKISIIHKVY